jgi:hypothetical protein
MSLKKRIKRCLAAFLKDELLEFVGYERNHGPMSINNNYKVEHVPFETIVMEQMISLNEPGPNNYDSNRLTLERQIQRCKEVFSNKVMEHIHVDAQTLINHEDFYARSVKLTLRVQHKKN